MPYSKKKDDEIFSLKKELSINSGKTTSSDGNCVICLSRIAKYAFVSCGHLSYCEDCSDSVLSDERPKCAICRTPIKKVTISKLRDFNK